jgi:hypothetical protein
MRVLLIALLLSQAQTEPALSGPQKGEPTAGFKVLSLNGPDAGKEQDHVSGWKGAPSLICFIHELTRPGARLLRSLDAYAEENRTELKALFVFLAADVNEAERRFPAALKSLDVKSAAGISPDGLEGPGAYGLNKDVTLTILLARDGKVVANWAIISPNETDFDKIRPELERLVGPALGTQEEMRAEILRLRAALAALKGEVDELKRAGGGRGMRPAAGREEMRPGQGPRREAAKEGKESNVKPPEERAPR